MDEALPEPEPEPELELEPEPVAEEPFSRADTDGAPLTGAAPAAGGAAPYGFPAPLLRALCNEQSLPKLLIVAAVVLFVTRFVPITSVAGHSVWAWDGTPGPGVFLGMIWPLLVAITYGALGYLPPKMRQMFPPQLLRTAPLLVAFLSAYLTYAAVPQLATFRLMTTMAAEGTLVALGFPVLLVGLLLHLRDPDSTAGRVLQGAGGLLTFLGGLTMMGHLFTFKHQPAMVIVHNLLFFLVLVAALASVALAVPRRLWPAVDRLEPWAGLIALVFFGWVAVGDLLMFFSMLQRLSAAGAMLLLVHVLVLQFAYVLILIIAAPPAIDAFGELFASRSNPGDGTVTTPADPTDTDEHAAS